MTKSAIPVFLLIRRVMGQGTAEREELLEGQRDARSLAARTVIMRRMHDSQLFTGWP